ncbi:hypothetical protein [Streptomyces sp. NRRL S-340]|uniref:sulfotransferase-like domain-containing protein n=1 Tax=Streptomyces sp. NRRL S-340 TaxID=1463901 RepID=UPI00055AF7B6|nr:hypothetical protein [Streptomyces sp. NRRL S-340]
MSATAGHPSLLALWSAPRSRSTVFFRMMVERQDVLALHEPFCNIANDGSTVVDGRAVQDTDTLTDTLIALAARRPVFFKDTTDCFYDSVFARQDFLKSGHHAFLLRNPKEIIPSYAAIKPDMACHEVGIAYLHRIHQAVLDAGGSAVILDSDDFVDRPEATVRQYCAAVGLPFRPDALRWQPGERPEWSQSARWHTDVSATSTIRRRERTYDRTTDSDPLLQSYYEHHIPFYEYLWERRLRIP